MRYAQIVMGPAGSGKSTYCSALAAHGQVIITEKLTWFDPDRRYFTSVPELNNSVLDPSRFGSGSCYEKRLYPNLNHSVWILRNPVLSPVMKNVFSHTMWPKFYFECTINI